MLIHRAGITSLTPVWPSERCRRSACPGADQLQQVHCGTITGTKGIHMGSTVEGRRVSTIGEKMSDSIDNWWLILVLGPPFGMLWAKHGYFASLRDGDFFLFTISALVALIFEWLIDQPAKLARLVRRPNPDFYRISSSADYPTSDLGFGALAVLGLNVYFFVDAPGDHSSWVYYATFWTTVAFVLGFHGLILSNRNPKPAGS